MNPSSGPQKVSRQLNRPTSGQQKKTTTTTGPSKMETLPPERETPVEFSKPSLSAKKEVKLEKSGVAKKPAVSSTTSTRPATDNTMMEIAREAGLINNANTSQTQSTRRLADSKAEDDLKKIASKPFSTKKQKKIMSSSNTDESLEVNSAKSTNFDVSDPRLSTPGNDFSTNRSRDFMDDDTSYRDSENLDSALQSAEDVLLDAELYVENNDNDIEIDINFGDIQRKFEELAIIQREREQAARDYVNHVESHQHLLHFPTNFHDIVQKTLDGVKTMEDLREKGIVSENEIQKFIREQVITGIKESQKAEEKKDEEEEDPYAKEKEKIRELDRILADKERESRKKKDAEKQKRLDDMSQLDESDISTDNIDKIFLTDWRKKQRSMISSTQDLTKKVEEEQKKTSTSKAKPTGHVKKNINAAFSKDRGSLLEKLTPEERARLDQLMAVVDKMIDGVGTDDELLEEAMPNPYALKGRDAERLDKIEEKMAALGMRENMRTTQSPVVDTSKLPKEKNLREQAERRALQAKNEAINQKLLDIASKDRLDIKADSSVVLALVDQLRMENPALAAEIAARRPKDTNDLEKQFNEIAAQIKDFDYDKELSELNSLSEQAKVLTKQLQGLNNDPSKNADFADAAAKLLKGRTELLDRYGAYKENLDKMDKEQIEECLENLTKLESKIDQMGDFGTEEHYRSILNNRVVVDSADEVEKSVQDYDREFTERLMREHPELFKENPEGDDMEGLERVKQIIMEEPHEGEEEAY